MCTFEASRSGHLLHALWGVSAHLVLEVVILGTCERLVLPRQPTFYVIKGGFGKL